MAQRAYSKGKQGWADGSIISTGTHKARLFSFSTASTDNIAIASSTNATPIVLTCTSVPAGWAVGNIVIVRNHATNTNANGTWQVTAIATGASGTITLGTVPAPGETPLSVVGNGVGGATGTVLNLSIISASAALPASVGGSTDQTLASVTVTDGIFKSSNVTWSANASAVVDGIIVYQLTATDRAHYLTDGKALVRVVTSAAAAATAIAIEPLPFALNTGTYVFSNGLSVVVTGGTAAGSTSLTVTSLGGSGVAAGHTGEFFITGANLPATLGSPGTQTVNYTVDPTGGWYTI